MYETGKGDIFGGLFTAGVIIDPEAVPLLQSLGKICYGKYNDLYERMKGEGKNLAFADKFADEKTSTPV